MIINKSQNIIYPISLVHHLNLQNLKFGVLLLCSFFFAVNQSNAECSINSGPGTGFFSFEIGPTLVTQIFTACETGPFNTFSFDVKSNGFKAEGVTVSIQTYPTSGGSTVLGTLDVVPAASGVEETFTFTPTTSFEVRAGQTYKITMSLSIVVNPTFRGVAAGRSGGIEFSQTTPTDASIGLATVDDAIDFRSGAGSGRMMNALAFNFRIRKSSCTSSYNGPMGINDFWLINFKFLYRSSLSKRNGFLNK